MGQFDGKTAVVTGGSVGIGLRTAECLATEGAHVFVTGRREVELEKAVARIGDATAVPGDVSVAADVDRLYERVRERGRGLDVVFANAAINRLARLEDLTEADHDDVFDINVKGTVLTVQKALPFLNEGASVILTSSTAAVAGIERMGAYGASKAAVRAYARTWARELGPRGIRVNAISPGPIDTAMFEEVFGDLADDTRAMFAADLPAHRVGAPDDVASAVLFLASPHSAFTYGAELFVDGGQAQV